MKTFTNVDFTNFLITRFDANIENRTSTKSPFDETHLINSDLRVMMKQIRWKHLQL
jgi:hypothetical protein